MLLLIVAVSPVKSGATRITVASPFSFVTSSVDFSIPNSVLKVTFSFAIGSPD